MAQNCTHRALHWVWRGTTERTKAKRRPERGMAASSCRGNLSQGWRRATQLSKASTLPLPGMARDHQNQQSQQLAEATNGGEQHHRDLRQEWRVTTQPTKASSRPSQDRRGTAPAGPCARNGERPPHERQQKAPARIGGEQHPQGPPPGLARDHPTKRSSRPQPAIARNCNREGPVWGLARDQPPRRTRAQNVGGTRTRKHRPPGTASNGGLQTKTHTQNARATLPGHDPRSSGKTPT